MASLVFSLKDVIFKNKNFQKKFIHKNDIISNKSTFRVKLQSLSRLKSGDIMLNTFFCVDCIYQMKIAKIVKNCQNMTDKSR